MSRRTLPLIFAFLLLAGCQSRDLSGREKGALAGGAAGAGLGAIVGHSVGSTGAGIAIGSAFGALVGGIAGNEVDNQHDQLDQRERQLNQQEQELEENRRLIEALKARGADVRNTKRGIVVNLPDVLFEFDSARLTPEARRTAHEIAEVVATVPGRLISVEGHTDSTGTLEYNQRLSQDRARSTADELVAEGVSRRQIHTRGFGETQPIASNKTEAGRGRNRRVEVIIENSAR